MVEGRRRVEEGVYSRKGGGDHRRRREGGNGARESICDECSEARKEMGALVLRVRIFHCDCCHLVRPFSPRPISAWSMSIASKVWDSAATHSSVVSSALGSSRNVKQESRRRSEKEAGGLEGRESERQ